MAKQKKSRGRGRPPLPADQKMISFSIQVLPAVHEQLTEEAGEMSVACYVRKMLYKKLGVEMPVAVAKKVKAVKEEQDEEKSKAKKEKKAKRKIKVVEEEDEEGVEDTDVDEDEEEVVVKKGPSKKPSKK